MTDGISSFLASMQRTREPAEFIAKAVGSNESTRTIDAVLAHGDDTQAIKTLGYNFCANTNGVIEVDGRVIKGRIVASLVGQPILKSGRLLEPGEQFPGDDPLIGVGFSRGKESCWLVRIQTSDSELISAAKAGELSAILSETES